MPGTLFVKRSLSSLKELVKFEKSLKVVFNLLKRDQFYRNQVLCRRAPLHASAPATSCTQIDCHPKWISHILVKSGSLAGRSKAGSSRACCSVCAACMKTCRILSQSQVQSRQARMCWAVEILCVKWSSSCWHLDFQIKVKSLPGHFASGTFFPPVLPVRNIWLSHMSF